MTPEEGTFVPFMLQGSNLGPKSAEEYLAQFFEGPLPKVGDVVELVCYERSPGSAVMKWRVRK
jgi:hypothetical protein